jgi:hypothetical protein
LVGEDRLSRGCGDRIVEGEELWIIGTYMVLLIPSLLNKSTRCE